VNGVLPDVNLLLALAWPNHQFHAAARSWFRGLDADWFTCAVTELGFVRLSANPAFTRHARTPHESTLLLAMMTSHVRHRFVGDSISLADRSFEAIAPRLQGHRQVTDAFLVALAHTLALRLATFDTRLAVICPWPGTVEVVSPAMD
jgi:toxin-antitoxin system PIN domain toxin